VIIVYKMENTTDSKTANGENSNGRVKWFNNKAGYGFLTVSSGDAQGTDVFVHHTAIQVCEEQFKYLVEGEYVEFVCTEATDSSKHKYQASGVRGVNGGKLMCETRNQARAARTDGAENTESGNQSRGRSNQNSRFRGGGPRVHSVPDSEDGNVEWLLVRRKRPNNGNQNGNNTNQSRRNNPPRTTDDN
jgi:cold shock CspA family protein